MRTPRDFVIEFLMYTLIGVLMCYLFKLVWESI